MTYNTIKIETSGPVAVIKINRPQVLNALNLEVITELMRALTDVQMNRTEIKGLIMTGSGDKSFVAGADIAAMQNMSALEASEFCAIGHRCTRLIETFDLPVIAAVNGFALGGGLELALACDFIYAATTAKLGLPEVSLGLLPGFGGTQRLSRAIGRYRAKELIFTGELITATQAFALGIVNKLCEPDKLLAESTTTLQKILTKGPVAVRLAKRVINEGADLPIHSGLNLELTQFPLVFATEDCGEGVKAFLEKRRPAFKGK